MTRARNAGFGLLGLGYLIWYIPYSGLAKAMSAGLLAMTNGPVGRPVLLPAAALGTVVAMPLTLAVLHWWHCSRRLRLGRVSQPSYPAVRARLARTGVPPQRSRRPLPLFVRGNAVRSPMAAAHREPILALTPELNGRDHCLDGGDVAEPGGSDYGSYVDHARRLQVLVRPRVGQVGRQRGPAVASGG
ncbi:hypothetical protein [Actinophytocola sp.]|uniref:hypothetical protein n=1 Tax=Actinophytocola sp. TaxID=1872138 RepID=UPI003899F24C